MSKIKSMIEDVAETINGFISIGLTVEDATIKALEKHGICKAGDATLAESLAVWGEATAPFLDQPS